MNKILVGIVAVGVVAAAGALVIPALTGGDSQPPAAAPSATTTPECSAPEPKQSHSSDPADDVTGPDGADSSDFGMLADKVKGALPEHYVVAVWQGTESADTAIYVRPEGLAQAQEMVGDHYEVRPKAVLSFKDREQLEASIMAALRDAKLVEAGGVSVDPLTGKVTAQFKAPEPTDGQEAVRACTAIHTVAERELKPRADELTDSVPWSDLAKTAEISIGSQFAPQPATLAPQRLLLPTPTQRS